MLESNYVYFASMNTTKGFKSYFQSIFDPSLFRQIYILKGGPGTGKSSLMKHIAQESIKNGEKVEKFLCSSDPSSLDGILLEKSNVSMIDGTSPHTADPKYPGVVENIINLGSFWDTKKLLPFKSNILELIREKKRNYQRAYGFLAAYGEIAEELSSFSKKHINTSKMNRNINVQAGYFFEKNSNDILKIRNVETFCKMGLIKLDTFEKTSKKIWVIEDYCFAGFEYLKALLEYAKIEKQEVCVSFSPVFPELPNAIYFPRSESAFVIGKRDYDAELDGKEYRYINIKRFLNMEAISQGKQKIKFAEKCLCALLNGATEAFLDAGKAHEELEEYYVSSMNFEKTEKVKKEILNYIFSFQDQ